MSGSARTKPFRPRLPKARETAQKRGQSECVRVSREWGCAVVMLCSVWGSVVQEGQEDEAFAPARTPAVRIPEAPLFTT